MGMSWQSTVEHLGGLDCPGVSFYEQRSGLVEVANSIATEYGKPVDQEGYGLDASRFLYESPGFRSAAGFGRLGVPMEVVVGSEQLEVETLQGRKPIPPNVPRLLASICLVEPRSRVSQQLNIYNNGVMWINQASKLGQSSKRQDCLPLSPYLRLLAEVACVVDSQR
jgi:hypothetical protein